MCTGITLRSRDGVPEARDYFVKLVIYFAEHTIPEPAEELGWSKVDLGMPYWRASEEELKGGAKIVYISKSFGDVHTSVPVEPQESERAGGGTWHT